MVSIAHDQLSILSSDAQNLERLAQVLALASSAGVRGYPISQSERNHFVKSVEDSSFLFEETREKIPSFVCELSAYMYLLNVGLSFFYCTVLSLSQTLSNQFIA